MLNKMMNIINTMMNMEENESLEFNREEVNELGFIVRKNSSILKEYGISVCGIKIIEDENGKDVALILFEDMFNELSMNVRLFSMLHELGHFRWQKNRMKNYFNGRDIELEFEADEEAMETLGYEKSIEALNEDIEFIKSKNGSQYAIDELNTRINNLMDAHLRNLRRQLMSMM